MQTLAIILSIVVSAIAVILSITVSLIAIRSVFTYTRMIRASRSMHTFGSTHKNGATDDATSVIVSSRMNDEQSTSTSY